MESKLADNIDLLRVGMWFHCRSEKEKCTSMFYSIPALKKHFTEKHPDEELKLPENVTQEELDGKVLLVEKPKLRDWIVNCQLCFKSFKTQSQLNFHNKKNPKCYLQPTQDHCSYETRRKSATSKETSPETTGISFKNTQKPRKLQNNRKIKKKRSKAPMRPSRKVSLTFSIRLRCATCSKSFSNRFTLNRHRKTHLDKRRFKCTLCESCFSRNDSLSKHMRKIHRVDNQLSSSSSSLSFPGKRSSTPEISDSRRFRCVTCRKSFPNRYGLTRHSATHSGKRPFKCTCGSGFITKNSFSKHIKEAYQQDKSIHQLDRKLMTQTGAFNCTTCGASFKWSYSLTRHITIVHEVDNLHSSETVKNPSLGGEFTPPTAIEISNSEQKPEGKYQPELQEPQSKSSSSSLPVPGERMSTPQISDSRSFRCVTCQKSFSTRYDLTRHSSTHSGKCPFKCTCGSSFRSKRGFSNHIKEAYQLDKGSHQLVQQLTTKKGKPSFSCTTCGAPFNCNSSLTRHVANVHRVDNLHSSETVNNSVSNGELTPPTAIEIINSERKLEEKEQHDLHQPPTSSSLPMPENLSCTPKMSDSRRFRCLTCRKSFPTRYELTRHSVIHSGKRPFKCTCGSGFVTKTSFSKHIKMAYQQDKSIHQLDRKLMTQKDKRAFNCTTCGASFKWNSNLTRHIATVHRVDNRHGSETVKNTSFSDELTPTTISNGEQKLEGKYQPDLQEPQSKSSSLSFPGKRSSTPQISDSRRFRCVTCRKSFPTRNELTRHSATHSGKLPFKCTCGSCFKTLDGFSKHIKEASQQDQTNHQLVRQLTIKKGERSFNCTTCGASFKWNANLTRHIATVHNADKKVEIQEGMVNQALGESPQGKAGSAPEEKKATITNIKVELNGMKNYCYKCHECPYQGKDPHRFQSHRQLHDDGSNVVICSLCGWFLLPSLHTLHQNLHHSQTGVKD